MPPAQANAEPPVGPITFHRKRSKSQSGNTKNGWAFESEVKKK